MLRTEGHPLPKSHRGNTKKDEWKSKFSFVKAVSVGHGGSGSVFAIDEKRVIKVFSRDEEGQMDLERERMIYDKLQGAGGSRYIVRFEEQWASGLILERLVSTLRQRLGDLPRSTKPSFADQWIRESCKGVEFLHQNGIFHGDVGCQNILVDANNHAKLCDFAGSRIGDDEAWISYEVRSQHPDHSGKQPTPETEIFALGSVIFEIWTCRPPYHSDSDAVVRRKFTARDFPLSSIENSEIQGIVGKCWNGAYASVLEICRKLESVGSIA